MKKVLLFGASGSIGQSAIKLVENNPERFRLVGISAHSRFKDLYPLDIPHKLDTREKPTLQDIKAFIERCQPDIVLNGVGGFAGLNFSRATIELGLPLALANKESLVAAGDLLMPLCELHNTYILPVDSEHSAIFQCLTNDQTPPNYKPFEKIYLTCSGGPFYGRKSLENIKPTDALKHPNWDMGAKITIDSATLANKCLEFFEAMHLYHAKADQIEIVVHRQSVVHSMVEFCDGSVLAQLSPPDMTLPIALALNYPDKADYHLPRQSFKDLDLSFKSPDKQVFRTLQVLEHCTQTMGTLPLIFNAVNEVAVAAFLKEDISFIRIFELVEDLVGSAQGEALQDFDHIASIDSMAREKTLKAIHG